MLERAYNIVGLPLWVVPALIVIAILWYVFGNRMASIAVAIGLVFITMRQSRENAVLRDRAKDDRADRNAIARANQTRINSRRDSNAGGLRDDDGFKRD